jgi:S-adenosylmethionine:tRNA ribosyltransferase-isomerase
MIALADGAARALVIAREELGRARVRLDGTGPVEAFLNVHGLPPLPPYIRRYRKPGGEDWARYQTVYAARPGAVAAPTAGLHFTTELLAGLARGGVELHRVTLHVGPGTFRPVRARRGTEHRVEAERFEVSPATAAALSRARREGRRVVAVGTTTARALETVARPDGSVAPGAGWTDLTIVPGHEFHAVDALLTNFHLPRSSLLLLVAAFAGRERVLRAYAHAVADGYRFYSYGDAMLIVDEAGS